MLAGRPRIEPSRRGAAESLRVTEIYVSVQGESTHAGKLCTFVRLTGCHLRCTYCDSAFAFYEGGRMRVDEVVERCRALGSPMVEITGGEPLLQPGVYPLMEKLLAAGFSVLLETSGAIDVRLVPREVRKIVDLKAPSSGESDRNDWRVLDSMAPHDELKFVIGDRRDYEWAREVVRSRGLASKWTVLFSAVAPMGEAKGLAPRELADWIIADRLPVRFQLQMHKYVWEPNARGT